MGNPSYKGAAVNVADVSRELGVRYILEGSVRMAGNRVRITTQLIDGTTGGHVWAERYNRELTDVFAVQNEVTQQVVEALKVQLTVPNRRRMRRPETANMAAYDLFPRAREKQAILTKENNARARALFTEAISLDASYARAHSSWPGRISTIGGWAGSTTTPNRWKALRRWRGGRLNWTPTIRPPMRSSAIRMYGSKSTSWRSPKSNRR